MDAPLTLDDQLCFALYAASKAMMGAYQPLLAELDLTYPQFLVLLVLWEEDGTRVTRLGERLGLDSGTLSPLLKRLEARGFVARRRNAEDERVVEIWLTAAGRRVKSKCASAQLTAFCRTGLNPAEAARLRETLKRLTQRIEGTGETS